MNKIAIVGPESSGKSALAEALANQYKEPFVREYAREYLLKQNNIYNESDLVEIAKGQLKLEKEQAKKAKKFLFCDTTLLVIEVWSAYKYGRVHPNILQNYKPNDYALHLLLKPDLIYQDDPLRENPSIEERKNLFDIYHQKLLDTNANFEIIGGKGKQRFKNAQKALQSHFN